MCLSSSQFKKGDLVFATTYGYPPYPAIINFQDRKKSVYRVKFISYRSSAQVDAKMLELFNQQTVRKYEKRYQESSVKEDKTILRKIKEAKVIYMNALKYKKGRKETTSNINNPILGHPKATQNYLVDTKNLQFGDQNIVKKQVPVEIDNLAVGGEQKQQDYKTQLIQDHTQQQFDMNKLDQKILRIAAQVYSKICNEKAKQSQEATLSSASQPPSLLVPLKSQKKGSSRKMRQKKQLEVACSSQSEETPCIILNNEVQKKHEPQLVQKQLDKHQQKKQSQQPEYFPLNLEDILEEGQSEQLQARERPLNACQNINLNDPDCSFDEMQIQEDEHRKFLDKMRYRKIKIGIYVPQMNIDRINKYMDILCKYYDTVKARPKHRLRFDIKRRQYILAIFQHKYIKPQHYLKHPQAVQKMVAFIEKYHKAGHEFQKNCQTEYFSVKAKLNVLHTVFRVHGDSLKLSEEQRQQLKATFERYKRIRVFPV